jgi:hypothetical protein
MDSVEDSSKATEMMCEEAQRLWGPRADAPTDGVVWEVSKQAISYPDLDEADPRQVTSMEWEFHVADGVENLHAFIYNVLDKAANATVVDVSMENGMIVYVSPRRSKIALRVLIITGSWWREIPCLRWPR